MTQAASNLPADLAGLAALAKTDADYGRSGCHYAFFIEPGQLTAAAQLVFDKGYFLEDIAGVDTAEGIMIVYHFDRWQTCSRVVLRVIVPHGAKQVPSIASLFSGADWHERECHDFFGVHFEGHPNLKPLLLPDDLGLCPLVKEQEQRRSIHSLLPLDQLVDGGKV